MERCFQEQLERIDRLMRVVHADDPYHFIGTLKFYDIVVFTCQCLWHLKDWVINDPEFHAKDKTQLLRDIHAEKCLLICGDLANGSKHLVLTHPKKTTLAFSERSGLHLDTGKGIHQEYFYIVSTDTTDPYHGMEIRDLLEEARATWRKIINTHHLSDVDLSV